MDEVTPERARSFDGCAAQYEDFRPDYPPAVFETILDFARRSGAEAATALEVGSGTGKATRSFAERGVRLTCIEPGSELIAVARPSLEHTEVEFHNSTFEDFEPAGRTFDLVFAAQSFHWVDQEPGYAKAAALLRPGGTLALFWNRPRPEGGEIEKRLDAVFAERAPGLVRHWPSEFAGQIEDSVAEMIRRTGCFDPPERVGFPWQDPRATEDHVRLLETYSAHATLDEAVRRHLMAGVREVVDAAGGTVVMRYECVVHLATRSAGRSSP